MLLFAVWISRDGRGVFEVELPLLHWRGPFDGIGQGGETRGNASVFAACAGEWCGWISAAAVPFLSRFHRDSNNRGWPWDLACDPALLEDHPGSLRAGLPLGGRVSEADDEGHRRAHAAPAHHRQAYSRDVLSICRPSFLTSLWPEPIGHGGSRGCRIISRRRLARAA